MGFKQTPSMQPQVLTVKHPILPLLTPNTLKSLSSQIDFWSNLHYSTLSFLFLESNFCPHHRHKNRVYYFHFYGPQLPQTEQTPILSPLKTRPPHVTQEVGRYGGYYKVLDVSHLPVWRHVLANLSHREICWPSTENEQADNLG